VWIQGWDQLPQKFHKNVHKLHRLNPDWEHKTWDEGQLRGACEEYGKECVDRFDAYEHFIQKVDFGRYVILYLYGGVTIDCDMEAFRSLSEIPEIDFSPLIVSKANNSPFETGFVTAGHLKNDDWFINNAFIATKARNPVIKRLVESCINDRTKREDYFSQEYFISTTTGPIRVSTVLKDSNMTILKPDIVESEYENENIIFIHDHQFSWTDSFTAIIIKTYLLVKNLKGPFIVVFTLLVLYIIQLVKV
jgi:mannosyltransferase OCH1-like enzyme